MSVAPDQQPENRNYRPRACPDSIIPAKSSPDKVFGRDRTKIANLTGENHFIKEGFRERGAVQDALSSVGRHIGRPGGTGHAALQHCIHD